MVIAAVLCFFPVLVNTLRGLTSVEPRAIELMHSYAAGEAKIFRRVRIPTALPFIFTALKVATVLAMIGAVVGEYFGGSLNALGVLILTRARVFQFDEAWAGIVVACLIGFALLHRGRGRSSGWPCGGSVDNGGLTKRAESSPNGRQTKGGRMKS